jgi:hypothetical protein
LCFEDAPGTFLRGFAMLSKAGRAAANAAITILEESDRMRLAVAVLIPVFGLAAAACGQQGASAAEKVRASQQAQRQLDAQRERLIAQAKQVFAEEMGRERAGDCKGGSTTYDFNVCFDKAVAVADTSLKKYEEAIQGVLGLRYPDSPSQPVTGVAGVELTPEQAAAEFVKLEQAWQVYLRAASAAARNQFDGGTGGPSFGLETHLRLVRNHMRELNQIYGELWL